MPKVHPMPIVRKTIILIGRNGNGKSSIGNAILGENYFSTTWSNEKKLDVKIRDNAEFVIYDSSGIGDAGEDMAGDWTSVVNLAKYIVDNTEKETLTSILFVLKYGNRFTKQEKDAVTMVKSIFGENVFRDFVIMAFSYGDVFENNAKDRGDISESFNQWCHEQTGDIEDLFEEVNYRCIIFNKHAPSHVDSINQIRLHMDSLQTIQTSGLQVSACDGQVITSYGTINKERVEANRRSCYVCCQWFKKMLTWLCCLCAKRTTSDCCSGKKNCDCTSTWCCTFPTKYTRHEND